MEIHPSARKHEIADADIEHATAHAMAIEEQDDYTRLYLGPSRSAILLEVVTIVREDGSELAIHTMKMQASTNGCYREDDGAEEEELRKDGERRADYRRVGRRAG